jgi:hypothetical protein
VEQTETAPLRVFTLADASYFPGLVALVNSLRVHGHFEPITVVDLGLTPEQREVLRDECDLVAPPEHSPRHPWLLESRACMMREADVVVYVDADVIVTEPLDGVFRAARDGKVVAFSDVLATRRFDEWEEVFGLRAPVRRTEQRYANAGFVAFSTVDIPELLPRWAELCEGLVGCETHLDTNSFESPVANSSQDALNALLMSEVAAERVVVRPRETVSQGPNEVTSTRVVDVSTVRCVRDGHRVALLHAWGSPKPWQAADRPTLRRSAYITCLRRLVSAGDVAIRAPDELLPPWLRAGARGRATLWYLTQARRPWRGTRERAKGLAERVAGRLRR